MTEGNRQPESELLHQLKEAALLNEVYKKEIIDLIYEIKQLNATIQLLEQENRDLLKSLEVLKK